MDRESSMPPLTLQYEAETSTEDYVSLQWHLESLLFKDEFP